MLHIMFTIMKEVSVNALIRWICVKNINKIKMYVRDLNSLSEVCGEEMRAEIVEARNNLLLVADNAIDKNMNIGYVFSLQSLKSCTKK